MTKLLVAMAGLPRSGKSTITKNLAIQFPVVCPDAIRLALHGQAFVKQAEPMVWTTAEYMVSSLYHAGHEIVVFDATNLSRFSRDSLAKMVRNIDDQSIKIIYCLVDTPVETCIERAKADGREYLIPVINRMNKDRDMFYGVEKWNLVNNSTHVMGFIQEERNC